MRRRPRLPVRLVAGQNGDPRFIPPVALGAKYANQVSTLLKKLENLKQIMKNDQLICQGHITQIKEQNERLKQLKNLNIKSLQEKVVTLTERIRKLNVQNDSGKIQAQRGLTKLQDLQKELKACREQSKEAKAVDKQAFEAQVYALSQKITSLSEEADARTKLVKEREVEMKRLNKFIADLYSSAELGLKKRKVGTDEEKALDAKIDEFISQNNGLVADFTELDQEEAAAMAEEDANSDLDEGEEEIEEELEEEDDDFGGGGGSGGSFGAPPVPSGGFDFSSGVGGGGDNMEETFNPVNNPYFEETNADYNGDYFYDDVNGSKYQFYPVDGYDLNREIKDKQGQQIPRETRQEASNPMQSEHEVKLTPLKVSAIHKFSRLKI